MSLIKCPDCGASCDSTDRFCRNCGCNLIDANNQKKDNALLIDDFNAEENISSRNDYFGEPEWVKKFKVKYKIERKKYGFISLIIGAFFLAFLLLAIFDKEAPYRSRTLFETVKFEWLALATIFGTATIIFLTMMLMCNTKKAYVDVVDGYYVVAYGQGYYWTLYIEDTVVDTSYPFRRYWSIRDIILRGTLPNNQKIIVTFGNNYPKFMNVEKVSN